MAIGLNLSLIYLLGYSAPMGRTTRILLVEDSRSFAGMVAHALTTRLELPVTIATSLAEAGRILDSAGSERLQVVTGLSLSDGRDTKVVQFFAGRGHPVIVLTGMYDETLREHILDMPVIDYMIKDSPTCIDALVALVERLEHNRAVTALVVDDSASMRSRTVALLELHRFHVLQASNGAQGLALIAAHPEIRLVLTDFDMPEMDGIEMVRRIRQRRPREELAIIGLSGSKLPSNKGSVSARFLKTGANDFLAKPYEREELDCRIQQNLAALESYARLRDLATRDYLTGLFNRRHFFAAAEAMIGDGKHPVAAMLDIDYFKKVNDSHGHDAGDAVLKAVARALAGQVRGDDLLARFGGEEFCILVADMKPDLAGAFFERLRAAIAALQIDIADSHIRVTTSIGVAQGPAASLTCLLAEADQALYRAKTGGRDRVEFTRAS